ncbi:MAG TPA: replication initiation protein [Pseudomonadales bacterium]|nr:replication initiation protein [Pseudomonadales bacterium]
MIIPKQARQNQLELFQKSLSAKPYCSNNLRYGLRIRNASRAISHKYIQPNHPNSKLWLLYDIDRPIGLETIRDDLNLPEPTFFVQNPKNNHAHLFYGLHTAVHFNQSSSMKPQRFAGAVDVAMTSALNADAGYVGLIAKNPLHAHWRTYNTNLAYDLEDFTEYVDLTPYNAQKRMEAVGLGRNIALFDTLRYWAYKAIRQGWPAFPQWHEACLQRAIGINAGFKAPLPISEVRATAKSVARYTHSKFSDSTFSAIQSARQAKSVQARLALSSDKREQARELHSQGVRVAEIARLLEVTRPTIYNWLKV